MINAVCTGVPAALGHSQAVAAVLAQVVHVTAVGAMVVVALG
jgi:aspartate-semialdehyde dehydrogenase